METVQKAYVKRAKSSRVGLPGNSLIVTVHASCPGAGSVHGTAHECSTSSPG